MENLRLNVIDTPENFQILEIILENNGIISPSELKDIKLPENIDYSKGIIIYGRAPIWLYSFLVHQCHPSAWVGVYDPRYGAIVVEAHKLDAPNVGNIIEQKNIIPYINNAISTQKVIALVGNPHSGKSVFLRVLRNKLKELLPPDKFQREVFVVRACPDGEGDWFSDIGEENGKIYRYKNKFDNSFVEKICSDIDSLRNEKSILFVDCGGKIDRYNQSILNKCTHCVILGTDELSIAEWRGAAKLCETQILFEVVSSKLEISRLVSKDPIRIEYGFLDRNKKSFLELPQEVINLFI